MFTVQEETGSVKSVEQPFSIDESIPDFAFGPRFILMMNIFTVVSEKCDLLVSPLCCLLLVGCVGQRWGRLLATGGIQGILQW